LSVLILTVLVCIWLSSYSSVSGFGIWNNLTNLGNQYVNHPSFIHSASKSIYLFGGAVPRGSLRLNINKNTIGDDGTIGNWTVLSNSKLLYPVIWHSLTYYDKYIYILGGYNEVTPMSNHYSINNVQKAEIADNGDLSTWQDMLNKLPEYSAEGAAVTVRNKIYYAGGAIWSESDFDYPGISQKIYMSEIATESGNLGVWQDAGNLPEPLLGHAMINIGNYLYLVGGIHRKTGCTSNITSCYETTAKVWRATINGDGTVSAWTDINNPIGKAVYNFMMTRVQDYLVVAGGRAPILHGPTVYNNVYYAKINLDGTLDPWVESTSILPQPTCVAGIASLGNKVYITGGHDGAVYFNSVWMATVEDITAPLPSNTPTEAPTPTPTVVPTPTVIPPSPTPTPIPLINTPVVLVPGMGACWNNIAITHNIIAPNKDWSLNWFDDTYDGIRSALHTAGYVDNKNFYLYCYDWRRDIRLNGVDLANFVKNILKDKPADTKVDLIGHSMGGLVARYAATQDIKNRVNYVITMASPNKGAAMAYAVWEAADYGYSDGGDELGLVLLATRIGSNLFDSPVEAIHETIPSIQNLLPTWNFLKTNNGTEIDNWKLIWRNNFLSGLINKYGDLLLNTHAIYGSGYPTLEYLTIGQRNEYDKLFGFWLDGKPVSKIRGDGDNAVLVKSAKIDGAFENIEVAGADHGEIVSESAGQAEILKLLNAGNTTFTTYSKKFMRAIVVAIGSPATFELVSPTGEITKSVDGLVMIDEPIDGNYQVVLTSTDKGKYTLYFGRINGGKSAWEQEAGSFDSAGENRSYNYDVYINQKGLGGNVLNDAFKRVHFLQNEVDIAKIKVIYRKIGLDYLKQIEQLLVKIQNGNDNQKETAITMLLKEINVTLKVLDSWFMLPDLNKNLVKNFRSQLRIIKLDIGQYISEKE
jgi:pimeloyl-ACP methyl ester carboxylesterase